MVVILNGVPRSGKTSIARALERLETGWVNFGVDAWMSRVEPERLPSIGLRPGGERPDLEAVVREDYAALWGEVRARAATGQNVVVDVGLHASYAHPYDAWQAAQIALGEVATFWVGVRCPISEVAARRARSGMVAPLEILRRWEVAVHSGHLYDLELETQLTSPEDCAARVCAALGARAGTHE